MKMRGLSLSDRIILALDTSSEKQAKEWVEAIGDAASFYKVGSELFTAQGPSIVQWLRQNGKNVFLDLKFHDIPATVGKAVMSALNLDVQIINVHCSGGSKMIQQAVDVIAQSDMKTKPLLIGVTVLTSMDQASLQSVTIAPVDLKKHVLHLAKLGKNAGLDGVVCSAHEVSDIKKQIGDTFVAITPGIRLASDQDDDQSRVMTPEKAFQCGADFLVMGRSILAASDPKGVLKSIHSHCKGLG